MGQQFGCVRLPNSLASSLVLLLNATTYFFPLID